VLETARHASAYTNPRAQRHLTHSVATTLAGLGGFGGAGGEPEPRPSERKHRPGSADGGGPHGAAPPAEALAGLAVWLVAPPADGAEVSDAAANAALHGPVKRSGGRIGPCALAWPKPSVIRLLTCGRLRLLPLH
jgi:hypothetical protein